MDLLNFAYLPITLQTCTVWEEDAAKRCHIVIGHQPTVRALQLLAEHFTRQYTPVPGYCKGIIWTALRRTTHRCPVNEVCYVLKHEP